jgi:hypothetical protein
MVIISSGNCQVFIFSLEMNQIEKVDRGSQTIGVAEWWKVAEWVLAQMRQ